LRSFPQLTALLIYPTYTIPENPPAMPRDTTQDRPLVVFSMANGVSLPAPPSPWRSRTPITPAPGVSAAPSRNTRMNLAPETARSGFDPAGPPGSRPCGPRAPSGRATGRPDLPSSTRPQGTTDRTGNPCSGPHRPARHRQRRVMSCPPPVTPQLGASCTVRVSAPGRRPRSSLSIPGPYRTRFTLQIRQPPPPQMTPPRPKSKDGHTDGALTGMTYPDGTRRFLRQTPHSQPGGCGCPSPRPTDKPPPGTPALQTTVP
jgi:hypothetical protein